MSLNEELSFTLHLMSKANPECQLIGEEFVRLVRNHKFSLKYNKILIYLIV